MLARDRELGDFFARLDATGIDYLVTLTADHGGHDLPERNRQNAWPDAQRVDRALDPAKIGKAVAETLSLPQPLLYGDGGAYYLSQAPTPAQRKAALDELLPRLRPHPPVGAVVTAEARPAHPTPNPPADVWPLC